MTEKNAMMMDSFCIDVLACVPGRCRGVAIFTDNCNDDQSILLQDYAFVPWRYTCLTYAMTISIFSLCPSILFHQLISFDCLITSFCFVQAYMPGRCTDVIVIAFVQSSGPRSAKPESQTRKQSRQTIVATVKSSGQIYTKQN